VGRRFWLRASNYKRGVLLLSILCVFLLFIKWRTMSDIENSQQSSQAETKHQPFEKEAPIKPPFPRKAAEPQEPPANVGEPPVIPVKKTDDKNKQRLEAVVESMQHSWKAYRLFAWGHDELTPLTKSHKMWMGAAVTMIDALDTLCIMGLKREFEEALEWISTPGNLDFNIDKDHTNVFETTIRVLGGLLGAYHCFNDPVLLRKAINLGDRLSVAFDTPSGIPFSDVNLARKIAETPVWTTDSSLSEVTTLQLEFNELSRLSNDTKYSNMAMKTLHLVIKAAGSRPLLPMYVDPKTGRLRDERVITMGARTDSYYEYLLKVWIQTGKKDDILKDRYLLAINAMKHKLLKRTQPSGFLFVGELIGGTFSPKMDHLVCFLSGTLVYGVIHGMPIDHLNIAKELARTCYAMYSQQPSGLSPEIAYFNVDPVAPDMRNKTKDVIVHDADGFNLLRPETVESLFYLYRYTGDPIYRDWGWDIFQAFQRHARVPEAGFAAVDSVYNLNLIQKRDKCDSFWYAETLKYFYLLFHDSPKGLSNRVLLPLDQWVINTEAHAFRLPTMS
jgi:endoplasmic reticulum Man9GlcNAc2 1,2-alpha-mannosidase